MDHAVGADERFRPRLGADEACRLKMVNKVVPRQELMPAAERLADSIKAHDPTVVRYAKQVVTRGLDLSLEQGLELLMQTDLRQALAALTVPTLWLYGEKDTLVSAETATRVTELLPSAETAMIAGAGHAPFLSHPNRCLSALEAFA